MGFTRVGSSQLDGGSVRQILGVMPELSLAAVQEGDGFDL
jgi:hypothetical protein